MTRYIWRLCLGALVFAVVWTYLATAGAGRHDPHPAPVRPATQQEQQIHDLHSDLARYRECKDKPKDVWPCTDVVDVQKETP